MHEYDAKKIVELFIELSLYNDGWATTSILRDRLHLFFKEEKLGGLLFTVLDEIMDTKKSDNPSIHYDEHDDLWTI